MNLPTSLPQNKLKAVDRQQMIKILSAGLAVNSIRFTRQAALAWLTSFPGDLEVNLIYARALMQEKRFLHAAPVLLKILRADPEYAEAAILGEEIFAISDPLLLSKAAGTIKTLGGKPIRENTIPQWAYQLLEVRKAFSRNDLSAAESLLMGIISETESIELVSYYHLLLTERLGDRDTLITLGRLYQSRFPDSLPIALVLAKALMDNGDSDEAVRLLHFCAASDPAGQVPTRMWGKNFAYKPIYPQNMRIELDMPIPAEVAGNLGLNVLGGSTGGPGSGAAKTDVSAFDGYKVVSDSGEVYPAHPKLKDEPRKIKTAFVREIEETFKKVATDIGQPALTHTDERFPAYVILTMKSGLKQQYGGESANQVIDGLKKLAKVLEQRAGWSSVLFMPDDLNICGKYNITPVDSLDPWKIKLALVDLDRALEKTGERIGSLLIVGGDGVVPFHRLPNPTDDSDDTVPSDNPYGALDTNYFVSDWPVGRLPGEHGTDPGLLLEQVQTVIDYHSADLKKPSTLESIMRAVFFWDQPWAKYFSNIGLTAAVWRRSSLVTFRPVGEGRNLFLSPNGKTSSYDPRKLAQSQVGYFNVHGIEDGSDWYGQKDPTENESGPDYPIALRPVDVQKLSSAPRIVYCEACYGGHVLGKQEQESIALSMLAKGVLAMIGSTAISYGSVTTPLIGADLLGYLIFKNLREGLSVGASLAKSKVEFVREMNRRQGYLDGEDQKTLISFVLYGDPLVAYDANKALLKGAPRDLNHPVIKTISDISVIEKQEESLDPKMIAQAKNIVKGYLPGIEYAEVRIRNQMVNGWSSYGNGGQQKKVQSKAPEQVVVRFSKQVTQSQRVHRQYARVTMDKTGKMVKLAVSR
jgi:tetratricopeptide (TPR) repeat protein